ncbi:BTAD domain-containing putative transcriptional regulator [Streptomyces sp. R21]|uniref:BTAD domain-containing putative transcriptional regulator n=1 Tax=Streptomyces sp. R21 TaxID=3238627 RepID=A0AB39P544_9ACTN
MTDAWQDAISHAERALRGGSTARLRTTQAVELLCADEHVLQDRALSRDLARLTSLLDSLGLQRLSHTLLRHVASRLAWDTGALNLDSSARNRLAVTLADRWHLAAAANVLSTALHFDPDGGASAARTLANLAALKLRLGDVTGAEESAGQARERLTEDAAEDLDVHLLVTTVLTTAARRRGLHEDADRLLADLEGAVRRLVGVLGGEHPQSLSALVALATAEFESARAAGALDRMERAVDVLAVASQKAAATVGTQHPQTVAALLSLAAAEGEAALDEPDGRRLDGVRALVTATARRADVMRHGAARVPRGPASAPEPRSSRARHAMAAQPAPRPGPAASRRDSPRDGTDEDTPTLRFSVLGPVQVWQEGEPLDIGPSTSAALLAALLLREGATVSPGELADMIWNTLPASGPRALSVYVYRLRRVLGPEALLREPHGYALRLAPGSLDLTIAEKHAAEAERFRAAGDPEQARTALSQALALWHGESLENARGPYAAEQRRRLEEWRLQLTEARLDLDVQLGRHYEVIPELNALTRTHPLDERLRELLMRALYRSGRRAQALAEYDRIRGLLLQHLGVEPSPGLQELWRRIHTSDPVLDSSASVRREARPIAVRPS